MDFSSDFFYYFIRGIELMLNDRLLIFHTYFIPKKIFAGTTKYIFK